MNKEEIMKKVDKVDFEKGNGLVPAIVQDAENNEVLMLAYMSKESLIKTLEGDTSWFYSRSRDELWNKGSTSGHFQFEMVEEELKKRANKINNFKGEKKEINNY